MRKRKFDKLVLAETEDGVNSKKLQQGKLMKELFFRHSMQSTGEKNEKQVYKYEKSFERLRERFPQLMFHKSKV